ncbi:hypothetical protein FHR90_000033 [Endobacter medicaginis]|uniref:DUF2029 domain-containing protein n=3 Tax=Endobacter medicaginis TaxID=1181271 RepID=A0A839UR40_9PROT|nr:hypothetical protein [Endobacter medicaginis]MBB3172227.1 hypothetical protein [Endobacter medicaginis]MCX5474653.1 hypothetical protein [Endobacter medicaginis]
MPPIATRLGRHGRGALTLAACLAVFVALLAWREPVVFLQGRFWAEECGVFYDHAWQVGFWPAALWSYAGYLNLPADLAGALARWLVPVELAPRVTEAIAIAGMACPVLVLATSQTPWLRRGPVRLAAVALVMIVPAAEEVWLNTLHVQFQLALATALIVSLDAERGRTARAYRALLLVAPLSGMVSVMLLPLLALRCGVERAARRERLWQLGMLGAGAAVQVGLFYHGTDARGHVSPVLVGSAFTAKLVLEPLLGMDGAAETAKAMWVDLELHRTPWLALLAGPCAGLVLLWLALGCRSALWLLLCAGLVAIGSFVGMLDPQDVIVLRHVGERYAFVPQACALLALLAIAASRHRGMWGLLRRLLATGLCVWLAGMALVSIAATPAGELDGRDWRAEVALWRADPAHAPRCWPSDDWRVTHLPAPRDTPGLSNAPTGG